MSQRWAMELLSACSERPPLIAWRPERGNFVPAGLNARPRPSLDTPLQYLKGIGPARAAQLARLGLQTVEDALFHVPTRHEDRTKLIPFHSLVPGESQSCSGVVVGLSPPPPGRSRAPFSALLRDQSGHVTATWFRASYLSRVLERGQRLVLHGKVERYRNVLTLRHPDFEIVGNDEDERLHTGRLVPIYPATEGLQQRQLRRIMRMVVDEHAAAVADPLPL